MVPPHWLETIPHSPGLQLVFGVQQLPLKQRPPVPHEWSQAPQLVTSVCRFLQRLPQAVLPAAQIGVQLVTGCNRAGTTDCGKRQNSTGGKGAGARTAWQHSPAAGQKIPPHFFESPGAVGTQLQVSGSKLFARTAHPVKAFAPAAQQVSHSLRRPKSVMLAQSAHVQW
jgi:hypothetical protein